MMVGICLWYVFWLCYPVRTPPRAAVAQPRNRQAVGSTAASNNVNVEAQVVPEVSLNIKSFEEGSIKGEERDKECAICIAGFEKGDISTILSSCNHKFHSDCIAIWLLCSSSHPQVFQPYAAVANSSVVGFLPSLGIYRSTLRRMCVHPLLGPLRITNLQISMIVKVRRELKLSISRKSMANSKL
nr:RING-H2 finger protein ATL52 [Ipomoea batatas]